MRTAESLRRTLKLRGNFGADALPVRAFPEKLLALRALEIFVEPFVGAGRDAITDVFFLHLDKFAAAPHAA
jgi:hypothetical protein